MTTIKQLLGQGDVKKPKRNFVHENVRRLKELKLEKGNKLNSKSNNNNVHASQPLTERKNAQERVKHVEGSPPPWWRIGSSPPPQRRSVINRTTVSLDTVTRTKSSATEPQATSVQHLLNRHPVQKPVSTAPEDLTPKGHRSQASQTLNDKQLETSYYEGVIRYPSARTTGTNVSVRELGLQTEIEAPEEALHPSQPSSAVPVSTTTSAETGLHWDEDRCTAANKDFVKMNTAVPEPQKLKTTDSKYDPNRAPLTYQRGVVPKYLKAQKKEMERERLSRAQEAADECPEGHVMLPDDIRLGHLTSLKQKYEQLVSQLNKLPVSTDTLRTRNRKKEIEGELDKIEAAIALFSREKVFVKANS